MFDSEIFTINSSESFKKKTLETFKYQFVNNPVYRSFCDLLYKHPADVKTLQDIPFLPLSFFKTHRITSDSAKNPLTFESSGTTNQIKSIHYVTDISVYRRSLLAGFRKFYGEPESWVIIALLPSYLERTNSSLVYMVNELMKEGGRKESGFYLDNYRELAQVLQQMEKKQQKTLLIGVSFALLDFARQYPMHLKNTTVIETGGMKGRKEEMVRSELHQILKKAFIKGKIHSEYGMTELLSQAWSSGGGIFKTPPWMKVLARQPDDPFAYTESNRTGGLNIIDLANINSCSFLATQDLGRVHANGDFEVLGRFDYSDIRGCNLMAV